MKSVVLIDDNLDFVAYLSELVGRHSEYHIIGSARSGSEAMLAVDHYRPDLVIMDIIMPDNDGLTLIKFIREKCDSYNPFIYVITAMETPLVRSILKDIKVDFTSFKPIHNENEITTILESIARSKLKPLNKKIQFVPESPIDIINDVLDELEMPKHLIGMEYIKTSLIFMWDDPKLKRNVCSKTASVFNRSSSTVSASIDTAIKACMDSKLYQAEFGAVKAEVLIFLNQLLSIVKKRIRGSDND